MTFLNIAILFLNNATLVPKYLYLHSKDIYEFSGYSLPGVEKIMRRLCNCYFKAFVTKVNDNNIAHKDQREIKKRRLTSMNHYLITAIFLATH